jgi:ABC-type transport system involved in multi-copper enzyme maturation permease subunit
MRVAPATGFDGERLARRLAPVGVLAAGAGVLLGGWFAVPLVAAGIALLLLAAASPTDGVLVLGPFARAELVAAARRGRVWRWRVVTVALCAVALYLAVYLPRHVVPSNRPLPSVSVFTQGFFLGVAGLLIAHLTHLAINLVAPVAAEEREKKRWEMLLTTDLRNREVLGGKIAGRLPAVFEPLLAVLPVLALLPVLGGVPPVLVGVAAVVGLSLVGGFAAVAAFCSVVMPTAEKATQMARGYLFTLLGVPAGLCLLVTYPPAWTFPASAGVPSPVEVRHVVEWLAAGSPPGAYVLHFHFGVNRTASVEDDLVRSAQRCAGFWVLVGGAFGLVAVARLRADRPGGPATAAAVLPLSRRKGWGVPDRPPVTDRPVAWWAEFAHQNAAVTRWGRSITWKTYVKWLAVLLAGFGFCRWWETAHPDWWPHLGTVAKVGGPTLLLGVMAAVTFLPMFLAAQTIARERSADTLQSLTLTDLTAADIVWQKGWGVLWSVRRMVVLAACTAVATVVTGYLPWWVAPLILLPPLPLAVCWTAVGLAFSAHAGTPTKAQRNLSVALFGGFYLAMAVGGAIVAVMPTQAAKSVTAIALGVLAVLAQPLFGWLGYRYAVRRLEREYA